MDVAREKSLKGKQEAWETLKQKDSRDYQMRMFRANYLLMLEEKLRYQRSWVGVVQTETLKTTNKSILKPENTN